MRRLVLLLTFTISLVALTLSLTAALPGERATVSAAMITMTASPRPNPFAAPVAGDDPVYGVATLSSSFVPMPYRVTAVAGGAADVSAFAPSCTGYASAAPAFRLVWMGGGLLRLFFTATNPPASGQTVSLIVQQPDGQVQCSVLGNDPVVTFETALDGVYNIWLAVPSQAVSDEQAGTLYITTDDKNAPEDVETGNFVAQAAPIPTTSALSLENAAGLNPAAAATFGDITLSNPFTPDPFALAIAPYGNTPLETLGSCEGYVNTNPDLRVRWQGGNLAFFFVASQAAGIAPVNADSVMVVRTPANEYPCNDDSVEGVNLNPFINLPNAVAGTYEVWVGPFSLYAPVSGILYATQRDLPAESYYDYANAFQQ